MRRANAPAGARASMLASLGIRNYRLYFIGQTLSGAGSWMQNVAIGWLVIATFHSGTILGIVTAARYAPLVTVGLWGGLIVDRVNARLLLVVTQTLAATLAITLGLLAGDGYVALPVLLALVVAIGFVDIFDVPARQTIVSQLVDRERLGNAIGLSSIASNAARALGPASAGAVIAAFGVAACFFVNAASFVAMILALAAMKPAELLAAKREPRAPGQVRAGLRYVRRTPTLLPPLVMVAVTGTLTWEFPVTLPLFTTSTFGGDAAAYGFAMAAFASGAVGGGVFAARQREVSVRSLAKSSLLWGLVLVVAAASPTLPVAYAMLVVVGICAVQFNVAARTLLQMASDVHMRGRVMSLWFLAWQGSTLIGAPLVGAIGSAFGGRWPLIVGGGAAIAVGAVYLRPSAVVDDDARAFAPVDRPAAELGDGEARAF